MEVPPPTELLERIRGLAAGRPLLERVEGQAGVYLVGGALRDLLMGEAPTDLDLVTEVPAAQIAARLGGRVVSHERFGTSTVRLGEFSYDLAQARRERYPRPGALPVVEPASLEEDLLRRDFTVNAIAAALGGPDAGSITAAPRALEDLAARRLRVLHPQSFQDDPTRLLRLVRYSSRLGFEIEPATRRLAQAAAGQGALDTVSGSRMGRELRLLAGEPDAVAGLLALRELGLDRAIHPAFGLSGQGDGQLAGRALALLPADARPDRLVLAVALRGVPEQGARGLLDRLAFEAEDRDMILRTAAGAEGVAAALSAAARPSGIALAVEGMPPELVALAGALGPDQAARSWLERLRHVRLEIGGEDLLRAGVPAGPAVGRGLRAALAARLDGAAPDRESELAAALEGARTAG